MQRSSVDLPQPDGADQAHDLMLVDVEVDAPQHLVVAEVLWTSSSSRNGGMLSFRPASAAGRARSR